MGTEYGPITDWTVKLAKKIAEAGGPADGKVHIYQDDGLAGFQIRVQGKVASWVLRTSAATVTLGYIWPEADPKKPYITTISRVTELAKAVSQYLQNDRKDWTRQLVSVFHAKSAVSTGKNDAKAVMRTTLQEMDQIISAPPPVEDKSWTFRQCVEYTIENRQLATAKKKLTPNGVKDMRETFNRPIFQSALDKKVSELDAADIERVRDYCAEHVGKTPRAAMKVINYSRSVLDYVCSRQSQAGLDKSKPWWNMLIADYEPPAARDRKPTITEIVKALILAEEYLEKPMPGRMTQRSGVKPGTLAGLWWLACTCQRATAGLSMKASDILSDENDADFVLAHWEATKMKAKRTHILPVPKRAWSHIDRLRQMNKHVDNVDWAFPSEVDEEVHATPSGVYRILYRLAGKDNFINEMVEKATKKTAKDRKDAGKKARKRGKRDEQIDLLAEIGVEWFTLHDLRRGITAVLEAEGIPGGASLILAHELNESDKLDSGSDKQRDDIQRARAKKATIIAYGAGQYIKLKKEAMLIWTDALLDEYNRQKGINVVAMDVAA